MQQHGKLGAFQYLIETVYYWYLAGVLFTVVDYHHLLSVVVVCGLLPIYNNDNSDDYYSHITFHRLCSCCRHQ